MAKINKALDLNKLFIEQGKGKLLKKNLKWPMFGSIKYDGNYVVVIKEAQGLVQYITSGGHIYGHPVTEPTIFDNSEMPVNVYIAERIAGKGLLGDRDRCSLRGPRGNQVSYNHTYKVHHILTLDEYYNGIADTTYSEMLPTLYKDIGIMSLVRNKMLHSQQEVDAYLREVVAQGYEGIMLKAIDWVWKDTKSRTIGCAKYKGRPTVDLLCVGIEDAEEGSKYDGMIGKLLLKDSQGRTVRCGSGMSDEDRGRDYHYFIGEVVEMFYERIADTYIQPTFGSEYEGVLIRHDKSSEDID